MLSEDPRAFDLSSIDSLRDLPVQEPELLLASAFLAGDSRETPSPLVMDYANEPTETTSETIAITSAI